MLSQWLYRLFLFFLPYHGRESQLDFVAEQVVQGDTEYMDPRGISAFQGAEKKLQMTMSAFHWLLTLTGGIVSKTAYP